MSEAGKRPAPAQASSAHDDTVAHTEARRVARALAPFGVLSHDALKRECGAEHWYGGGFEHALAVAVDGGLIEKLPGGFYRDTQRRR